jgi:lipopolysaccharide export system ATP-binding protein
MATQVTSFPHAGDAVVPLFQVQGLSKRFGSRQVVSGFDLQVQPGEVVGLLGANGAGKTTTFRMIVGLLPADAGTIIFKGRDLTHLPMYQRCRHGLGYLAQEPTLFSTLSVEDNLRVVLEEHFPRQEVPVRLERLLGELHLTHLRQSLAGKLSGGERRRLEVTRALSLEPSLMFFDEPFPGIDPRSRGDIIALIRNLKERGVAVLITDHIAEIILGIADRVVVMAQGSRIAEGTPSEIVADPAVRSAYLGDDFVWKP